MQFKIEAELVYSLGSQDTVHTLKIKSSEVEDDNFKIDYLIKTGVQADNHHINIVLKKTTSVRLTYAIICTTEETVEILECTDFFPIFTSKYLTPGFKKITTTRGNFILHAYKNYPVDFIKISAQSFCLKFILDAPFLHPSWSQAGGKRSTAAEPQDAGTVYNCDFSIMNCENDFVPAIPMLYPDAHKSCFILTDHCDFDTTEKLKLFLHGTNNDGWIGRNLKITKGVFTLSSKTKDFNKNDSLEDVDYLSLINELYKDGSEIVPHALKSKGQLTSEVFHEALNKIVTLYKPQTWIDHGNYLKYCYSQGAKNNASYKLIDALKAHHFLSLWSYHDVNVDAINSLNIFTSKSYSDKLVRKKFFSYLLKGKWMIAAHHFRSMIHRNYSKNILSDFLVYTMGHAKGSFIKWKTDKKHFFQELKLFFTAIPKFKRQRVQEILPYSNNELLKFSEAVFLEERRPLAQYKDGDIFMFSTFETTHTKDIYHKQALDQLISEYGLHIGHTYILNTLPYIANIFSEKNNELSLSQQWIDFTTQLSSYVNKKLIWNATMGSFTAWLKKLLLIELNYINANTFYINNKNVEAVVGFTFIIPSSFSSAIIFNQEKVYAADTDKNFHFFCLSLLPQGTSTVVLNQ
ncbi:hypothetical protein BH11BAC6_BH11BAC6_08360 [soil metagenome]